MSSSAMFRCCRKANHQAVFFPGKIVAMALLLFTSPILGVQSVEFRSIPDRCETTVFGTSNVHDWKIQSHDLLGRISFNAPTDASVKSLFKAVDGLNEGEFRLNVRSLHGGRPGMDSVLYDALKAAMYPEIHYSSLSVNLESTSGSTDTLNTLGLLTVAGVSKRMRVNVQITQTSDGNIRLSWERLLLMSEFDIQPPTALLGMIRAGDEVRVNVTCEIARSDPTGESNGRLER